LDKRTSRRIWRFGYCVDCLNCINQSPRLVPKTILGKKKVQKNYAQTKGKF
jgi:hypothetical protein